MKKAEKKRLRSGFTTGACAAAAAKAAAQLLITGQKTSQVDIPFPDNSRVLFALHSSRLDKQTATCSVIKDAGDDPDVTNGAEIVAKIHLTDNTNAQSEEYIQLLGGKGVGTVTKPGLAASVGGPAINPVPQKMIRAAVAEAFSEAPDKAAGKSIVVTISVPDGEQLAEKTLNKRLGIIGGLSILGTTGIVRPVSADAWTATISASMDVAREAGLSEIILSTGRTSEKAVQNQLTLPEEAYAMMGDYLEFSLLEAARHDFSHIHLAGMWAKILKAAMKIPQTHVRNGALEADQSVDFLAEIGVSPAICQKLTGSNTAREIYQRLVDLHKTDVIKKVCLKAKEYAEETAGLPVSLYLVDSTMQVVENV